MKKTKNPSPVESIIRHSGFVVAKDPSPEFPATIILSYRNNPDGSVCWLWPEGSRHAHLLRFSDMRSSKWITGINKICFALGLGGFIAHGRMKLYADISTASYILNEWHLQS